MTLSDLYSMIGSIARCLYGALWHLPKSAPSINLLTYLLTIRCLRSLLS